MFLIKVEDTLRDTSFSKTNVIGLERTRQLGMYTILQKIQVCSSALTTTCVTPSPEDLTSLLASVSIKSPVAGAQVHARMRTNKQK